MRPPHRYDPACPDCIPCIIDMETGQPYARDSAVMATVMRVWNAARFEERQAFLDMTTNPPGTAPPGARELFEPLMERIGQALNAATSREVN